MMSIETKIGLLLAGMCIVSFVIGCTAGMEISVNRICRNARYDSGSYDGGVARCKYIVDGIEMYIPVVNLIEVPGVLSTD